MTNQDFNDLVRTFCNLRSDIEVADFLKGILTPQELAAVSARLQIIKKLKAGVPQHDIAAQLGVGVATVTRGSKEIKQGRFTYIEQE